MSNLQQVAWGLASTIVDLVLSNELSAPPSLPRCVSTGPLAVRLAAMLMCGVNVNM